MCVSLLFVSNYCQGLFFKIMTVFELEGFDSVFELECLAGWLQGRGSGEDIQGFWGSSRA